MKKIILVLAFFLITPEAFASHVNYTCTDFPTLGGSPVATCTDSTISLGGGTSAAYNLSSGVTLTNGATYYVSFTLSGTGTVRTRIAGDTNDGTNQDLSTSQTDLVMVAPTGNTWNGLLYQSNSSFVGTISAVCVATAAGECNPIGTTNRLAKFATTTTLGDSLFSDDGSNMTLTAGNLFMQIGSLIDTFASGALNFGTATATTMTFGRSGQYAIFNSNVGVGTSTPGSIFSIQNIANFTTGTTTFYGNGINLTNGCFAVNGVCISNGSGNGVSSIAQTYGTGQTGAITFATSSTAYNGLTVNQNITNSGGAFTFSPTLSGTLGVGGGGTGSSTPLGGILVGNGSDFIKSLIVGSGLSFNGTTLAVATSTNCSSSASPAVCGSAPSGSVAMATGGSTLVVNTTAVTANSQIFVIGDSSLGTRLGITCNTATGRIYSINARTAGTSFTIKSSANPVTNKACLSYWIVN